MKVLYIYRNHAMGFSIGKVFRPIEEEMRKYAEVDSVELPVANYSTKGLWRNIRCARRAVKQRNYDIVHITGAEHYLIPFLRDQNVVVTVHDLGSIFNGIRNGIAKTVKKYLFITSLKKASLVTFISEKSMNESVQYVDLKKEKTVVIPNAVDKSYKYSPKQMTECPTILHIGTNPNKNLIRVAQALKGIKCKLRIIGKLNAEQVDSLKSNEINYTVASGLTDSEIYDEYKSCDIVSFPSYYEGFGMPIIEGQSVGRVVVTSNISPTKEVAGDAAVLVDPLDVESIRSGFIKAISSNSNLIELGLENVKKYSIEQITLQHFAEYKRLLLFDNYK